MYCVRGCDAVIVVYSEDADLMFLRYVGKTTLSMVTTLTTTLDICRTVSSRRVLCNLLQAAAGACETHDGNPCGRGCVRASKHVMSGGSVSRIKA